MIAGCTADEFKAKVKGYWSGVTGVNPIVTLTYVDADGIEYS